MKILANSRPQRERRSLGQQAPSARETFSDQVELSGELNDFKTNATMIGVFALGGGLAGAIPGLGAATFAAPSNEPAVGKLTKAAALGGFVSNLVGTGLLLSGRSGWVMAVPGVLGAVTCGSWAYATRNHC